MTIQVEITHKNPTIQQNIRVHRVTQGSGGLQVEDGVIIKPGESQTFIIWGDVKLAIEEEYEVPTRD
jgi:hypothetical protein